MKILFFLLLMCLGVQVNAQSKADWNPGEYQLPTMSNWGRVAAEWSGQLTLESFERDTFPPPGWKKVTDYGGIGWQRAKIGSQILGFDPGSVIDVPPKGGEFIAYASWGTGDADRSLSTGQPTDQWLITPQVKNIQPGDTLKFYLRYFSEYGDSLDVLISTTSDSIKAFKTLVKTLAFSGAGNNEWKKYRYILTDYIEPGKDIYIAFREHVANTAVEGDALFLDLVEVSPNITNVKEQLTRLLKFELHQNYPNPFNSSTNIGFSLPATSKVTLRIYNLKGQVVKTLIENEVYVAGQHNLMLYSETLSSGIYYYKIETLDFSAVRKLVAIK